jgi:hypothetical protein
MNATHGRARFSSTLPIALLAALVPAAGAAAQAGAGLGDPITGQPAPPRVEAPAEPPARAPAEAAEADGVDDAAIPEPPGAEPREAPPRSYGVTAVDANLQQRLRALDSTWAALANTGGPQWFSGIGGIIGGGASIAIGAILLDIDTTGGANFIAPYLITLGATSVLRATLVDLILPPNPRPTAIRFANMPDGTQEQALERVRFGEEELEALAEYSMIVRIVDASLSIAGALAVVPAYLVPRDWTIVDPLEALIFIGPGLSLIFGVITLASPSGAEQRWDAYKDLRRRLEGGDTAALPRETGPTFSAGFSIDPRGGGAATLTGRF